jgi:hypothetical protein
MELHWHIRIELNDAPITPHYSVIVCKLRTSNRLLSPHFCNTIICIEFVHNFKLISSLATRRSVLTQDHNAFILKIVCHLFLIMYRYEINRLCSVTVSIPVMLKGQFTKCMGIYLPFNYDSHVYGLHLKC